MQKEDFIINFSIIAHIDHGKSTLCDRLLEVTKTISEREMKDRVLDNMDLEREKGITIKMQPVSMRHERNGKKYLLNLIDTPGHIDFSKEVERALSIVDVAILLVDATQGIQAQTLSVLDLAKDQNLKIIPVITKIDSPIADIESVSNEIVSLLSLDEEKIFKVSGKTGDGVLELLNDIIDHLSQNDLQKSSDGEFSAFSFDGHYSTHKGFIPYVKVLQGSVKKGSEIYFYADDNEVKTSVLEVGIFAPQLKPTDELKSGEIGYIVTGIRTPNVPLGKSNIISSAKKSNKDYARLGSEGLSMMWASIYPENGEEYENLKNALYKLKLTDSALNFKEDYSVALGKGFICGFLGALHLEIVMERIRREFEIPFIITPPVVPYRITKKNKEVSIIKSPNDFDEGNIEKVEEKWAHIKIITTTDKLSPVLKTFFEYEVLEESVDQFGDSRLVINASMPFRELVRGFFNTLKSVSSGYASLSYREGEYKDADIARINILVAGERADEFTKLVSKRKLQDESKRMVELLADEIPRRMFTFKVQAENKGKIISSKTISAFRKDVTAKLYGGDITRKMKLREKQKKGKKKMTKGASVDIPFDVRISVLRKDMEGKER